MLACSLLVLNHFLLLLLSSSSQFFLFLLLQVLLALVHFANGSWYHAAAQLPIAAWHVHSVATGRSPVQVVLGREDQFEKQVRMRVHV